MDQNLCYVVGKVTWFQNWEPKQWGGTLACRIALPDINIDGVGSIEKQTVFAKIGYKKEEMVQSNVHAKKSVSGKHLN